LFGIFFKEQFSQPAVRDGEFFRVVAFLTLFYINALIQFFGSAYLFLSGLYGSLRIDDIGLIPLVNSQFGNTGVMRIGHSAKNAFTKADQQRVKQNYLFPFSMLQLTDTLLSIIHNIAVYNFLEEKGIGTGDQFPDSPTPFFNKNVL